MADALTAAHVARLAPPPPCAPELSIRRMERAGRAEEVLAPTAWTDARVEAWLDGAPAGPLDLPLAGAVRRHARDWADPGAARGRLDATAADALAAALEAAMLTGWAAPAPPLFAGPLDIADLATVQGRDSLARRKAACVQARLAASAAPALADRLRAVAEAIDRCDGERDACADPARNPALTRALREARGAGADDALLRDALRPGAAWQAGAFKPPPPLVVHGGGEAGARLAAEAVWRGGAVIACGSTQDAAATAAVAAAPQLAINLSHPDLASDAPDGEARLDGLARLLALAAQEGGALTVTGLHARLVGQGLTYDTDAARAAASLLGRPPARPAGDDRRRLRPGARADRRRSARPAAGRRRRRAGLDRRRAAGPVRGRRDRAGGGRRGAGRTGAAGRRPRRGESGAARRAPPARRGSAFIRCPAGARLHRA